MPDINKAVQFMIEMANDDTHGYDQEHRNSPDFDCSSLVATALNVAGFNVSPYSYTGNLSRQLESCGFVKCKAPFKTGDIHLNINHHVCMQINDTQIAQASINEFGGITGGQTGDQTGKEIYIRDYYEYKYGWNVHYRYNADNTDNYGDIENVAYLVIKGKFGNGDERKAKLESYGYDYAIIQDKVNELLARAENKGSIKSNEEIAREVILGKWGNGYTRKNRLKKAGYNYTLIQEIVNRMI